MSRVRTATTALLALILASLSACSGESAGEDDAHGASTAWESDASPPVAGSIRYRYEWDLDGVKRDPASPGWTVDTDLGYEVTVTEGYLVSASVQLTQCPEEESAASRVWDAFFGIPSARAGHSSEFNPAAVTLGVAESLLDLAPFEAGTVTGIEERFCSAHYLVAPGDKDTRLLPKGSINMVDKSLYLQGTWRRPGSTAAELFTIDTSLSWGELSSLYPPGQYQVEGAAFEAEPGTVGSLVVIRRRPATMFDGVDFETVTDKEFATRVLSALFESLEIGVVQAD